MEIFQRLWNDFWNCLLLCLWLRASSQWTPMALQIHMSNCICFQALARYGVLAVASGNISVLHKSLLCKCTHKILLVMVLIAAKSRVYSKRCKSCSCSFFSMHFLYWSKNRFYLAKMILEYLRVLYYLNNVWLFGHIITDHRRQIVFSLLFCCLIQKSSQIQKPFQFTLQCASRDTCYVGHIQNCIFIKKEKEKKIEL